MTSGFIQIPDAVAARVDLSAPHKLVLGVLARLQSDKAVSFPSYQYLAKAVGLSQRQVVRVVKDLAARGEIIKIRHPYKTNTYSVPWVSARNVRRVWAERRRLEKAG